MKYEKIIKLCLICSIIGGSIAIPVLYKVNQRPERAKAISFLSKHQIIQEYFGTINSLTYKNNTAEVSWHKVWIEGKYQFVINGSKQSGTIKVFWRSNRGKDFQVYRLELLRKNTKPKLIWKEDMQYGLSGSEYQEKCKPEF